MPAQPTLLCIDDEENGLKMRKWLFEAEGFRVFTALDGPTGIDLFKSRPIDVVILDYNMPDMDGIAVAETLKKVRSTVPIIMLSGYPVPAKANRSIDALLTKGESPAALLTTTASLLRIRSHSHRELDGSNIAFVDEQRRSLDVTDGVCALLGYSRSELLTMRIDDVTAPVMRRKPPIFFSNIWPTACNTGSTFCCTAMGRRFPSTTLPAYFQTAAWSRAGSQRVNLNPEPPADPKSAHNTRRLQSWILFVRWQKPPDHRY